MKKNASQLMNYQSQSHASGTLNNMTLHNGVPKDQQKQLYEVDTEKLLHSNDKVTINELWKSSPQPSFPYQFLKLLDLDKLHEEAQEKVSLLQKKIEKRKFDEKKREEAKIEKAAREREEMMEQRRQRME